MKSSKVKFIDANLEKEYNSLPEKDPIKRGIKKAIEKIKEDCQIGENAKKDSRRFVKNMLKVQNSPISKEDKKLAKEVKDFDKAINPFKTRYNYDKQSDILSVKWSGDVDVQYSEEIKSNEGHQFVIDYDKEGRIVSIEIFNWSKGRKKK